MIVHIVLFNLRSEDPVSVREAIERVKTLGALPMVRSLVVGECVEVEGVSPSLRNRDYRYGAVFTFATEEDMEAYLRHPTHHAIAGELRSLFSNATVIDLKVTDAMAGHP